jgi:hypothetical protein
MLEFSLLRYRMNAPAQSSLSPGTCAPLLAGLKARGRSAQMTAAATVNRELMRLYWHIGRAIVRAQRAEGWGAKVVERLAKDLAAEFPEMGGLSAGNRLPLFASFAEWEPVEISKP